MWSFIYVLYPKFMNSLVAASDTSSIAVCPYKWVTTVFIALKCALGEISEVNQIIFGI